MQTATRPPLPGTIASRGLPALLAAALLALLLLRQTPAASARGLISPLGLLNATVIEQLDDGTAQPLPGATLTLTDASGATVASVTSVADGTATLIAPAGTYTLTVAHADEQALASMNCGDSAWNTSNVVRSDGQTVIQEPLALTSGATLCQQFGFTRLPPPAPPPIPAPPAPTRPVYLTFDDGYVDLCQTVALVNQLNIHVTFFLTGQAILANPDCVRQLIATGNELGNHTYAHEDLTKLSAAGIVNTLQLTENAAESVAGVSTQPLCRPPYGAVNAFVRQIAANWGCTMYLWSRDTLDWAGSSPSYIEQQALSVSCTGEIVLMHTQGYPNERFALPVIVQQLQAEGCQILPLPKGS